MGSFYAVFVLFLERACGKSLSFLLKIAMKGLDQILLATTQILPQILRISHDVHKVMTQ